MRTATVFARLSWAVVLALILALRLLTPGGFMPAFDRGAVSIIVCPDADGVAAPAGGHHHHGDQSGTPNQACPYASASGLGSLAVDFASMLDVVLVRVAVPAGRALANCEPRRPYERPPARGPPLPA